MTDCNSYYPEACEVVIPITLRVPIMLQPEVIGKPPVCNTYNGNGHQPAQEEHPAQENQEQPV